MEGWRKTDASMEDLFRRGFRLAYFLLHDRPLAIRVVLQAVNKLNARCRQESKRTYWRDKYLKRGATKISRADSDTLQWLIYFESEAYEKEQELRGEFTIKDLIIRYIKSLIQTTTGMSSFYVAIGLHRLLHNYSTSDVQRVYELVTERFLGADEYRRAKRLLMNKLVCRFGNLLRTVTVSHGEVRFDLVEDQGRWVNLVRECLTEFVPWSTSRQCLVPATYDVGSAILPGLLSGNGHGAESPDTVEMNRCHAFIDPVCYSRLVKGLGFDSPEKRLAVPRFFMAARENGGDDVSQQPPRPPDLTSLENASIQSILASESARRRRVAPRMLKLLIDGNVQASFTLRDGSLARLPVHKTARLIEIWTEDERGELLLNTHLIRHTESQEVAPSTSTIFLNGSRKLILEVSSADAATHTKGSAVLAVDCYFTRPAFGWLLLAGRSQVLRQAVAAAVLIGVGWTFGVGLRRAELLSAHGRAEQVKHELAGMKTKSIPPAVGARTATEVAGIATQRLVRDDLNTRGGGSRSNNMTIVSLSPDIVLVNLELPIAGPTDRPYRAVLRLFPQGTEILSEKLVNPKEATSAVTIFPVPAALLTDDKEYLVELESSHADGMFEVIGSYMFHVTSRSR